MFLLSWRYLSIKKENRSLGLAKQTDKTDHADKNSLMEMCADHHLRVKATWFEGKSLRKISKEAI
jgi:hypothetical protein